MPEHIQYEDDELFNLGTHHEASDVPIRPLFWAIGIFVVFAAISHAALWFLYKGFVAGERRRMDPPQTAVAGRGNDSVPKNQPLLQPFPHTTGNAQSLPPNANTPVTDLIELRASEEQALTSYGWVDRQKGIVRIPIDQAEELIVQRGLPVRQAGTAAPGAPASAAPDANGGAQQ